MNWGISIKFREKYVHPNDTKICGVNIIDVSEVSNYFVVCANERALDGRVVQAERFRIIGKVRKREKDF
jgi:hypothetical protein